MKFITITSKKLQTLNQYYFDRADMCEYFEIYAPLFLDYSWDQGSQFSSDNFYYFRDEDEFYWVHKSSGLIINWYKHIGRTNTCNLDISLNDLKEVLLLLNDDILSNINYNKWYNLHIEEFEN